MVLAALKAMAAGAVQDRMAAIGAVVAALILLTTAWVLGIAAIVLLLAARLGMVGALASVTGGLVLLALAIVGLTRQRNLRTAGQRANTRAIWTATAVNAAGALLRRGPVGPAKASPPDDYPADAAGTKGDRGVGGFGHRSVLLITGGLALILLGLFLPSGSDDETEPEADPGPEDLA